jgi:hypothetical protein
MALASAGFIVAGDVINKYIGGPSDSSSGGGSGSGGFFGTAPAQTVPTYVAKQTKFKLNPAYQNTKYNIGDSFWTEGFMNNINGISDMLVQFAKQVYDGLGGLESLMKGLPTFQEVAYTIADINKTAEGSSTVFLPKMFTSKKQIVDMFIDDLAKKAP